jgi:hypothetical protein
MIPKPIPTKLIEQGIGQPRVYTAPPGEESEVGDLNVLFLEDAAALLQGRMPNKHRVVCWWEPSDLEKQRISKGVAVRLTIIGATEINPMVIDVGSDLEGILFSPESNGRE